MSKPLLGLTLGIILGLLDGLSGFFYPQLDSIMFAVIVESTVKGILCGLLLGFFSKKVHSPLVGIAVGVAVGLILSYVVVLRAGSLGQQLYVDIMLPGAILGAVVGFATQRFGKTPVPRSAHQ